MSNSTQERTYFERPDIDETVLVLGSGIAGCTAAWILSEAGYKVSIIEQLDLPFSSTSIGALGIHLGGRYPRHWETATECLQSAILLKKLMPFAFGDQKLRFLVANDSPVDFEAYVNFYNKLKDYYASMPREDQLFGESSEFFRVLRAEELSEFSNVVGGIETQESCFDMDRVRTVLLETLAARNVPMLTSTTVMNIEKVPTDGYKVTVQKEDGADEVIEADNIINAAGPNARVISQMLGEMPRCRLDLRTFQDVQLSADARKKYPFPFVVIPGYMHHVPLGPNIESLCGFYETIDTIYVDEGEKLEIPESWREQLQSRSVYNSAEISEKILSAARERFMPNLGEPRVNCLYPGVAVSFNPEGHIKKQQRVIELPNLPGFYTLTPTKASHALMLSLQALNYMVRDSIQKGAIEAKSPYLSSILEQKELDYVY
jgi:hypothetical protein